MFTSTSTTNEKLAVFQSIYSKFIDWNTVISSSSPDLFSRLDTGLEHLPGFCTPDCLFHFQRTLGIMLRQVGENAYSDIPEKGRSWVMSKSV